MKCSFKTPVLANLVNLCIYVYTYVSMYVIWHPNGAWTHDPQIKDHMLYWLNQPGTPAFSLHNVLQSGL